MINIAPLTRNFMRNIIFFFCLGAPNVVFAITCWREINYLVLCGVHSPLVVFCLTLRSFWCSMIVLTPIISINDILIRNVLVIFNISQSLLKIFLIFGKIGLYITNVVYMLHFFVLIKFYLTQRFLFP